MLDHEAGIVHVLLAAHALQVALPALAVGRVRQHEVELLVREGVVGQGGVLGTAHDVVGRLAFALQEQVGLADRVGLGVDLLAVQVRGHLLAALLGERLQRLLGHGQHSAGPARAVVEQVGAGRDLVGHRQEDEVGHQLHGVARRPVLAGLLVVLLVEASHQLLEDRAHAVVVEAGVLDCPVGLAHLLRSQVHVRRSQLLDKRPQRVRLGQARHLVTELEVVDDLLDVGREAVQIRLEVRPKPLLAGPRLQVLHRKRRRVVERLACRGPQSAVLVGDTGVVQHLLPLQHGLLGRLQHCVQSAKHGHGQNHVPVLAAHVEVPEHVVGNAPDVVGDPAQLSVGHDAPPVCVARYGSK